MFVFLALFAFVVPLLILAAVILTFIASWKVHEKAGLPGWSGIIPYYNYYARAARVGMVDTFWKCLKILALTFGVSIVGTVVVAIVSAISLIGAEAAESVMTIGILLSTLLNLAVAISAWALMIWAIVQLVKIDIKFISYFGKGTGFAIGMLLVPYVFYPMLAWGQAEWMSDIIDIDDNKPVI
jgi:hypothetical protein